MAKEKGNNALGNMKKDEFERLVIEYQSQMYRLALSIVKNDHDAEDIVGDAILTAYERLETLRDASKFRSWIMTIIANNAKTFLRKKKRVELTDSFEDKSLQRETDKELWSVVMRLAEKYSKIVVLYYYFGFSTQEISKILHLAQGTVKTRLARAREQLRKELE
ncbi:MAG: RNA polymerase sigma factor [Acetatifactor sp.]|nr:RNA polymerase sigma factor [Acetatifactor sp.]